jgi:hypothetical protein
MNYPFCRLAMIDQLQKGGIPWMAARPASNPS